MLGPSLCIGIISEYHPPPPGDIRRIQNLRATQKWTLKIKQREPQQKYSIRTVIEMNRYEITWSGAYTCFVAPNLAASFCSRDILNL